MRGLFLPPSSRRGQGNAVDDVPVHTDSFQENAGRLIVWVLGNESAFKCAFENRLAQSLRSQKSSFQFRLKFLNYREAAFHVINDPDLLSERRKWNWSWPNIVQVEVRSCHVSFCLLDVRLARR